MAWRFAKAGSSLDSSWAPFSLAEVLAQRLFLRGASLTPNYHHHPLPSLLDQSHIYKSLHWFYSSPSLQCPRKGMQDQALIEYPADDLTHSVPGSGGRRAIFYYILWLSCNFQHLNSLIASFFLTGKTSFCLNFHLKTQPSNSLTYISRNLACFGHLEPAGMKITAQWIPRCPRWQLSSPEHSLALAYTDYGYS